MKKRHEKLIAKVVTEIKEDVERDCESKFSSNQINELKKSKDFLDEKNIIFKKEPGRKYFWKHWEVFWARRVALGFSLFFFLLTMLLVIVDRGDDAGVMLGALIGAGFLYFSLKPFYTEYQKYVYNLYFDDYKHLLDIYVAIQGEAYVGYERLLSKHMELKKNYDALIDNKLSQSSIAASTQDETDSAESKGNSELPKDN